MKLNKKGFTLAELLIVVAIIAVLVAIAIPVFTAQLNKARLATDTANVRSYVAEQIVENMDAETIDITITKSGCEGARTYDCTVALDDTAKTITVSNSAGSNSFKVDADVVLDNAA